MYINVRLLQPLNKDPVVSPVKDVANVPHRLFGPVWELPAWLVTFNSKWPFCHGNHEGASLVSYYIVII